MQDLSSIWNQVEALLSQGISIIPVRDKADSTRAAKTPYQGWKLYQNELITKDELWKQMEKYNTSAIAIICGKVSGNIEVIDIDVKYYNGIDAKLFKDLQGLYPDIWAKIRVHKTPSGGYHLIYRCEKEIEGNQKLAGRHATEDELLLKPKVKHYNFLETRGEGGYIVAPPSMGYSIHSYVPIPVLTWSERCSVIQLCKLYNEIVKVEKEKTVYNKDFDIYSENPFEHYNNSTSGEDTLINNGWSIYSDNKNDDYIYYTRPARDASGISATFHKSKRLFYFFTTSTEFDELTWYSPATALGIILFNGDKKKLYRHLVDKGFGVMKPDLEKKIAKKKAIYGGELPTNISKEAKAVYELEREQYTSSYPCGIYWKEELDTFGNHAGYRISRERLYRVSEYLGFRIHNNEVCLIDGYIVHKVTERKYFDALRDYIKEEDADEYEEIVNTFEAFLQKSGTFTVTRLPILDPEMLLLSTKQTSYKFFNNCYVEINPDIIIHQYPIKDRLIWHDQIQPRDFSVNHDAIIPSLYYRYLFHAIGVSEYLQSCIGYLAHEFKDEESGYIVVLTEECPDPKQGGGSGKNIFSSLFRYTTTIKNIPGTQVQYNEKFLQAWNFERILSISDVPKRFDFTFLKELSTGTGILKKLWQNEQAVQAHQMPKLIVSTNFSYEVSDGGIKRRIIPIEFKDFFTKAGGVNTYFDAMFPADWSASDWLGYDNFIIECIQHYLKERGKIKPPLLTEGGWQKQFEQEHGAQTYEFIHEHMPGWVTTKIIPVADFNALYNNFCITNNINIKYRKSSQSMNAALVSYCEKNNIEFNPNKVESVQQVKTKCKVFGQPTNDQNEEIPF